MSSRFTLIKFDSLPSTNTYAKDHFDEFLKNHITCIVAKTQTRGHGQKNRPWISCEGGLYVTFAFHLHNVEIPNLAQLLSRIVAKVLEKDGYKPTLKWPNDIFIDGKKVGGVLCETTSKSGHIEVALGLGLNVNIPQHILDSIDQPATSLFSEKEYLIEIAEQLVVQLEKDGLLT